MVAVDIPAAGDKLAEVANEIGGTAFALDITADDAPQRLADLPAIEACYSVAGTEHYVLLVRAASPRALEGLLQEIRARANVATRTTIVLQTFFERRPPDPRA